MVNKERRIFLKDIEKLECELLEEVPTDPEDYDDYKLGILEMIYKLEEDVRRPLTSFSRRSRSSTDNSARSMALGTFPFLLSAKRRRKILMRMTP